MKILPDCSITLKVVKNFLIILLSNVEYANDKTNFITRLTTIEKDNNNDQKNDKATTKPKTIAVATIVLSLILAGSVTNSPLIIYAQDDSGEEEDEVEVADDEEEDEVEVADDEEEDEVEVADDEEEDEVEVADDEDFDQEEDLGDDVEGTVAADEYPCRRNSHDPNCIGDYCTKNPYSPNCIGDYCTKNPDDPKCIEKYCTKNPYSPNCIGDYCTKNPYSPNCIGDYCTKNPDDPKCPSPLPKEICGNGIDDNDNGQTDEGCPEICDNGKDDDGDELVDKKDPDCPSPSSPQPKEEKCDPGEEYNKKTEECEPSEPLKIVYCKDDPKDPDCIDTVNTALGGEKIPNQYLVLLKDNIANNTQSLRISLQDLTNEVRSIGAKVLYTYGNTISGFAIKAPNAQVLEQVLATLRADPRVGVIEQDQTIVAFADKMPNGIKRVDGGLVNMGVTDGSGSSDTDVDIAIIDSGIELDNPDLNIFQSISFVDGTTSGNDDDIYPGYPGHGTHVAGIAAAKDNGIGIAGMAPGARLWSIKTLQFNPSKGLPEGSFTSLLAAVNYVIDNADKIDVVNLSLGCLCISDPLEKELFQAIHKAVEKNVTFVVAAGNHHMDAGSILPANHPDVITVSSIADDDGKCGGSGGINRISAEGKTSREADDTFASFSNYGDVVDISAPGVKIESTYVNGNGMDFPMSGTSQAAPHVAGAAALYKNFKPQASPAEIRTELIGLGVQSTTTSCDGNGHGYFNGDKDIMPEPLLYMKNLIISIINNNPILAPNG